MESIPYYRQIEQSIKFHHVIVPFVGMVLFVFCTIGLVSIFWNESNLSQLGWIVFSIDLGLMLFLITYIWKNGLQFIYGETNFSKALGIALISIPMLQALEFFITSTAILYQPIARQAAMDVALNLKGLSLIAYTIGCIIIGPINEEIFCRGLMQNFFMRSYGNKWGLIMAAIVFTLPHFEFHQDVLSVSFQILLPIFISALWMCYLYLKTRSLMICIVIHIANNMFNMFRLWS